MTSDRIFYTKPSITEREIAYVTDAVTNGWGEKCYEYIGRFESALASHLGAEYVIATSSCTGALHMGLAALGVGPGDEVIVPDVTWVASAAPVTYLGARPVLVDVLPGSWCMDPAAVEAAITPRTKAILAVHLYGNLCEMDELIAIGGRHGIPVVEDAAEAIGSVWHGRRAGSMGEFSCFSFHGTKTMTTGEGGAFVTRNQALFEQVLTLSNHGRRRGETKQFWPSRLGFKYKLSNVQAAIGLAQVERADELIAGKRHIFERYRAAFHDLPVSMNPEPQGTTNGFWMPTIVRNDGAPLHREELIRRLAKANIDARVFFWPLSATGLFPGQATGHVARQVSENGINLPTFHDMSDSQMDRVVAVVRDHFDQSSR